MEGLGAEVPDSLLMHLSQEDLKAGAAHRRAFRGLSEMRGVLTT